MKAIVIDKFCDTLDQVRVSEVPTPEATVDNVLVRVRGVGVNYVDTLYILSDMLTDILGSRQTPK
ncbi:hypothetical protein LLEC1_03056 [Akanthomyces lecanii]|uniref:Uncharacterized protein n=1 Tax=Cordyceps confragosa TaxID=2714763 RepID=A0A179I5Y6_CORDF|nr:hypothetical protein LLEC1_03056 [Akanthomyces lecanii]